MPPLFQLVREVATGLPIEELYRTVNMGIGMVIVVDKARVEELRSVIPESTFVIGSIVEGTKRVRLE